MEWFQIQKVEKISFNKAESTFLVQPLSRGGTASTEIGSF